MTRSVVRYAVVAAAWAGVMLAPRQTMAQAVAVVGDTVRVIAPTLGPGIRGELAAVRGDTLFVRRYGATLAVPMSRVERVDVRRRRSVSDRLVRGVAYRAALGLAAGFALGTAAQSGNSDCADDCNQAATLGAASGLGMGIVLGGIIALTSPMSRWEHVYPGPRVAAGSAGHGVALSLNVKL